MTVAVSYLREHFKPTAEAVAHWRVHPGQPLPEAVQGFCPMCGDECYIDIHPDLLWGATAAAAAPTSPPEIVRLLMCNCLQDHGQPSGVPAGCGRYWLGVLTLDDDDRTYTLRAEDNAALVRAASSLDEAFAGEENAIRAASEKWLGGIVAILGVLSVASLAVSDDVASKLTSTGRVVIAGGITLGVTLATLATFMGYLAAYGWPRRRRILSREEVEEWDKDREKRTTRAAVFLKTAIAAALLGTASIAYASISTWFFQRAS